jgi:hypothetical protein
LEENHLEKVSNSNTVLDLLGFGADPAAVDRAVLGV